MLLTTLVYATGGRLLLMLEVVVDMASRVVMVNATLINSIFLGFVLQFCFKLLS